MSFDFLLWLFAFIIQAALLGRSMYALICLTDLESDFINPYDLSNKLNKFAMLEYGVQIAITVLLLGAGKWFVGAVQGAVTAYLIHQFMRKQMFVDATDAYRLLKPLKTMRTYIFVAHCLCFVIITYRLIESAINSLLTPEGRETAKKLFKEASATLHGY